VKLFHKAHHYKEFKEETESKGSFKEFLEALDKEYEDWEWKVRKEASRR